ncbi:hypothetical protein AAHA92_21927 [Salvia divinorum]|uniref:Uncharacterized protein n=1 Tax=Salvia divinorum TaxID=28513 RepID=A0ABD1GM20_SALDI
MVETCGSGKAVTDGKVSERPPGKKKILPKKNPQKENEVGLKGTASKVTTDESNCPEKIMEAVVHDKTPSNTNEKGLHISKPTSSDPEGEPSTDMLNKGSLEMSCHYKVQHPNLLMLGAKKDQNELSEKGISSCADTENKCDTKNVKVGVKKPLSLNAFHALAANKKSKSTTTSKLTVDEVMVEASKKGHCGPSGGNINKETTKYVSSEQDSTGDVVKDTMTKDCSTIVEDRVVVESSDKGPSVVSGIKRPWEDVIHNTGTSPSKTKEKKCKGKVVLKHVKGKEKDVPNDSNVIAGKPQ